MNPASDSMEKVVKNAGKVAVKFGSNQIGTEHILYGLCSVKECMASKILKEYGITVENLLEIFAENSNDQVIVGVDVELTPRSKEIISMAKQVAIQLSHNFVGPEHLLFALLTNTGSFAVRLVSTFYKANVAEMKSKVIMFFARKQ